MNLRISRKYPEGFYSNLAKISGQVDLLKQRGIRVDRAETIIKEVGKAKLYSIKKFTEKVREEDLKKKFK